MNEIPKPTSYNATIIKGQAKQPREIQKWEVFRYLQNLDRIPSDVLGEEVGRFYHQLGLNDMYFVEEPVEVIADHVLLMYGQRISALTGNLDVIHEYQTRNGVTYTHVGHPEEFHLHTAKGFEAAQLERKIDKFLDSSRCGSNSTSYFLEFHRSGDTVSSTYAAPFRYYRVAKSDFVCPDPTADQAADINLTCSRRFLQMATRDTWRLCDEVIKGVLAGGGPIIRVSYEGSGTFEKKLFIGYRQGSTQNFFSRMSYLYHYYGLFTPRKYLGKREPTSICGQITITSL